MREFELLKEEPYDDNHILLFCMEDQQPVKIEITDFRPYFYIHEDETQRAIEMMIDEGGLDEEMKEDLMTKIDQIDQLSEDKKQKIVNQNQSPIVEVKRGFHTDINDLDLSRVYLSHPGKTPTYREKFDSPTDVESWESDIPYTMRFKIDVGLKDTFKIPDWALTQKRENWFELESWKLIQTTDQTPQRDPNNLYFDIEVGGEDQKLPEDDQLNPITSITAFNDRDEELITWVWREDLENREDEQVWHHPDVETIVRWETRRFDDERKMLSNFFSYTKREEIQFLSGWYSDKYDTPYVIERSEEIGIDPSVWSRLNDVDSGNPGGDYGQASIAGIVMNDLERRYDILRSPQSSSLENVAEEESIMSWDQHSSSIQDLWMNDLETMIRYNANDVMATFLIDEEAGITEHFIQKYHMTGTRWEEIERATRIDTYYLLYKSDQREILPRGRQRTHKEFGGGRVLLPDDQGIFGPVSVLDLSKIYPSIMITLNLSYEKVEGVDPIRFNEEYQLQDTMSHDAYHERPDWVRDHCSITDEYERSGNRIYDITWDLSPGDVISQLSLGKNARKQLFDEGYDMQPDGNLDRTFDWEMVSPPKQPDLRLPPGHEIDHDQIGKRLPNGVRIDMREPGILVRTLKEMFELRYTIEERRDNLDQSDPHYQEKYELLTQKRQEYKDLINSMFGYTGYKRAPLFRPEIAMTTTFIGRNILEMCEIVAKEMGYQVVYGDTDSIMVNMAGFDMTSSMNETVYEAWRIGEIVNDRMDDFAENFCDVGRDDHMFELEMEKIYERYFAGDKKKRYAGLKKVTE